MLYRLFQALIVIWGISLITFSLLHLFRDPALILLPPEATKEDVALLRKEMGLDQPLPVQYFKFLAGMARGDFGMSFVSRRPALSLVLERMPMTLWLAASGLLLAMILSIPLGVLAAVRRNQIHDHSASVLAVVGQAMPLFWLDIMLIIIFAVKLRLLPASGAGSFSHIILPASGIAVSLLPIFMRLTRSRMIEILSQDYIRTARAKGLGERAVLFRHALRNALIPVITILGFQFGMLLGGAVITETIFAWPGVASLVVESIFNSDFPVVQAAVALFAILIVLANLITDITIAWLDPKVRFG
ncbi:MAG: ABC transporter permease [Deltaproteobacteria bacterium RBG_19FT_COMBO_52_11]|nr:MAG: ABC transporter permease [Deltaproteobacteria bacterium RBG_19FT_COMBO_52_11]